MEPKHLIPAAIALSVIGHLVLALSLILVDPRPFEPMASEAIAVDIVTPDEAVPPPKPSADTPRPPDPLRVPEFRLPEFSLKDRQSIPNMAPAAPSKQTAPAASQQASRPAASSSQAAALGSSQQTAPEPRAAPQPPASQAGPPPPPPAPSQAAPAAPEPDITVKYGVLLGLPEGDGGMAAFKVADLALLDIDSFRRHLKTCSTLPGSVSPGDKVRIVVRAFLAPDGRLTRPPALIEASASVKGPALMQAAISALQACQPYAMLPASKYNEWKVLDLSFTPQDFAGG